MRFSRFGRTMQLRLDEARDLEYVLELDEAHWVATSAPISTLRCDATFLQWVDTDGNGRIRVSEVKAAVRWLLDCLQDRNCITQHSEVLTLGALHAEQQIAQRIVGSAAKMLGSLGRADDGQISLEDIRLVKAREERASVSEAGVVLPGAADNDAIGTFISDVMTVAGAAAHPSGRGGIGAAQLDQFLASAAAYLDWHARGETARQQQPSDLYPLGDETPAAYALFEKLADRVDQYFAQCEALAFDASMSARLPPANEAIAATDFNQPASIEALLKQGPLAKPAPEARLAFGDAINPSERQAAAALQSQVLQPLLGEPIDKLTPDQWQAVKQKLADYGAWFKANPGPKIAALDNEKLHDYLRPHYADAVRVLIQKSHTTALQLDDIRLAEKLVLYQSQMLNLANNFVSFPHLYDARRRALFETGALVMDGRRFDMAVHVENRAEHAKVTQTSDICVLYIKIERTEAPKAQEMAVPVTSGGIGNLAVGKRGVFFDVHGLEWDAQVVQIIENPISLREAIVAPFKRVTKLISGKVEQLTGSAEKQLDTVTQKTMTDIEASAVAASSATQQAQATQNRGMMAGGLIAGGGVAFAAIGTALTYIGKTLIEHPWAIAGGIGGAVLIVLVPTLIQGFLKLRRRDLSAVLEGSGWAINTRMRMTLAQSRQFTHRPSYPKGALGLPGRGSTFWAWFVGAVVLVGLIWGGRLLVGRLSGDAEPEQTPATQVQDEGGEIEKPKDEPAPTPDSGDTVGP